MVAIGLLGGDFLGGKMTVNQVKFHRRVTCHNYCDTDPWILWKRNSSLQHTSVFFFWPNVPVYKIKRYTGVPQYPQTSTMWISCDTNRVTVFYRKTKAISAIRNIKVLCLPCPCQYFPCLLPCKKTRCTQNSSAWAKKVYRIQLNLFILKETSILLTP